MMDVRELRIGNYVFQDFINKPVCVRGLFDQSDEVWYSEELTDEDGYNDSRGPIQSFHGIPLTEEWLVKLGFEITRWSDDDSMATKGTLILKPWIAADLVREYDVFIERTRLTPCRYVHQLQNLYFALTGEELTIKE